jgi:hypothetical protein
MRFPLVLSAFLLLPVTVCSQKIFTNYDDYRSFLNTRTLIVLEDNPLMPYNFEIQRIIEKEWTITEYEIITYRQFEEKRTNPDYSFLLLTEVTFEKDRSGTRYNFLNLILGGPYRSLSEMPDLSAVPLSYLDADEDTYMYKLSAMVRIMQNHVREVLEYPEILDSDLKTYFNSNKSSLENKTLFLLKEEVSPDLHSLSDLNDIYPYKVEFVTTREIQDAIEARAKDVVFLHLVRPDTWTPGARCYKIILGANDAGYFYFDTHQMSKDNMPLLIHSDFKKMIKSN